ncbi:MAG TPA: helix-turn-helix transcriptional regulator [Caulobacteraceae bacterium]
MTETEYEALLDLIYEAALEPDAWTRVMLGVADALGGSSAWLSRLSVEDNTGDGPMIRIDPCMPGIYRAHFWDRNPLHNVADPKAYVRGWTPKILTDEEWMPKEELHASEFYNDFLKPQDIDTTLMIRLGLNGADLSVLNINKSCRQGRFEAAERAFAARLHPHLIRAFALSEKAAALRLISTGAAEYLDRSPHAVFLVAGDGVVRRLNSAAERLIARGHAQIVAGRLRLNGHSRQFDALVATALAWEPQLRGAGSMAVERADGLPLSLSVAPVRADLVCEMMNGPSALICVTDLEAGMDLPERRLHELFGLTRAEAAVAKALFEGMTTHEAAERLGVSFFTVRAHLARICEKTRTRGQVDLARLLMRVGGFAETAPPGAVAH